MTVEFKPILKKLCRDNQSLHLGLPNKYVEFLNYEVDDIVAVKLNTEDKTLTIKRIDV